VVVATGVALRVVILATPLGRPDADEVLTGLMARHLLTDHVYPPFFWAQHYGGTLELAPVALSMRLFGDSTLAMRLPTIVLGGVNALVLWRLARRLVSERRAQVAGLLLWIAPAAAIWFGVREQLFYVPTVLLGLLLGLFAHRIRESGRTIDYAVLGLVAGVGFWTSPNLLYFVLPAAVVLVWRPALRARATELRRGIPVFVLAAVVGAWPWILDLVEHDKAPLHANNTFPVLGTYPSRFGYFFTDGLPAELGLREVFTYRWIGGPLGVLACLGLLAVIGVGLVRALRAVAWDGVGFALFPFVFASIAWVTDDPNVRYLFFVVPFVAVLVARVGGGRRVAALTLAAAVLVTAVGLQRLYTVSEVEDTGYRIGNVGDVGPALDVLRGEHIDAIYGDYWVAYRIEFESDEAVTAEPSWGIPRYPPYQQAVEASPRSAWVVSAGAQQQALLAALAGLGVHAEVHPAGELTVVIPDRPVGPLELPEAARHPV
jgi:hypothetical protein